MRWTHLVLAIVLALPAAATGQAPQKKPGPRPAIWKDDDMTSVPEPKTHHDAMYYDFLNSTFGQPPRTFFSKLGRVEPAWNVNAWDEVPDSSWYTNRNHLRPMTPEEIRRGPNRGPGPELSGPLVVLEGKTAGIAPGFGRTRDARGNIYFIKFDPHDYLGLTTAADVIASRLFYAMGFNVPEQWIIYIRPEQIELDPEAQLWDETGRRRIMTQVDVKEVLSRAARLPDGCYRAVASLLLSGKPKGGFKFYGTRKDDPNDLIPHQHRRELRGLHFFCAWLNHNDIRVGNTLDMYVEEEGRKFLRHYLLDFGSTLGSETLFPDPGRVGFSYYIDAKQMAGPFFTLGIYQPHWREHLAPISFPSVGRFESSRFSPAEWRPNFPIVSFAYMDDSDAFWAAKIVMSFTEEQIRAAVQAGELGDPAAEEYLVRTLMERQHKIGQHAFSQANPLDRFTIVTTSDAQQLEFQDLAVRYGFVDPTSTSYVYTFSRLPEAKNSAPMRTARERRIPLAEFLKLAEETSQPDRLFVLTLRARRGERNYKDKWAKVYLEWKGSGFYLRGWERER